MFNFLIILFGKSISFNFCNLFLLPFLLMFGLFVYWASLIAQLIKNLPAMQETPIQFLGQKDPLEKGWLSTPVFLGFPYCSAGKESVCNVGDLSLIPGYSGLENSMNCIDSQRVGHA